MTTLLAVSLTLVNLNALYDSLYVFHVFCGYKDVAHNCLQMVARVAFIVIAVRSQHDQDAFRQLRTVESLTFHKSNVEIHQECRRKQEQCGLCFELADQDISLRRRPNCVILFIRFVLIHGRILAIDV